MNPISNDNSGMEGRKVSHYNILEKVGEGGMGVVYKAEDIKLKRIVALKFLSPNLVAADEDRERFLTEAQAAAALDHPSICTVYEFGEDKGQAFIAMSYIEGQSVKDLIDSDCLSIDKALAIAIETARGLEEAHMKGIIHRDIKSANIMVTEKGRIKIMDFGLAKLARPSLLTKMGTTMGTLSYMSPEQARGDEVDHRTDIWSLGVVLYELLAGRLPFRSEYDQALIYSILNEDPKPIRELEPSVPPELEHIVSKALEKDPDKRYQSASDMIKDLSSFEESSAAGDFLTRMKFRAVRHRRIALAATTVIALILAATLFRFSMNHLRRDIIPKSVAVLPFENLGGTGEDDYFTDGITEDIIVALSKVAALTVISRESVMQYKNTSKSYKQIAEELGVRTILTGSIRMSKRRTRIVGKLIEAETGKQLWGEAYNRELKDIFMIQSDVAEKIATALQAKLSPSEKLAIAKEPTTSLTAYEHYLKGRDFYYRYDKESNEAAITMFKKAIDLDPEYALAYAGLGDAYAQRANTFGFDLAWFDSSIAMGKRAAAIDSNLAEAYKSLGTAYAMKGWLRKALKETKRSVELNPNFVSAVGNVGGVLLTMGKLDEALYWLKKACDLSPTSAFSCSAVGSIYFCLIEDEKSEKWFNKALLLRPNFSYARSGLGYLFIAQGKYHAAYQISKEILAHDDSDFFGLHLAGDASMLLGDLPKAESHFEKVRAVSKQTNYYSGRRPSTALGYIYLKEGKLHEAEAMFEESRKLDMEEIASGSEWPDLSYDLASIHAARNETKEAYGCMKDAINKGWRFFRLTMRDPLFADLQNDETFINLMNEVKMKVDEMRTSSR